MDIRHLRYFLAVADKLNFREAAEQLHITQPPLSMQIRAMEEELGVRLFDRTKRSVELTSSGRFLLDHARSVVAQFDSTIELAKLAGQGSVGRLRIGFTASIPIRDSFSMIMRDFRAAQPNVMLEIFHASTASQIEMLQSGSLDLGFLRLQRENEQIRGIRTLPFWTDPLTVFCAADSALADLPNPLRIQDLAKENFVTFLESTRSESFQQVTALCSQAGFLPHVAYRARDAAAVLGFVAAGVGIAILPDVYRKFGVPGVVSCSLAGEFSPSPVVIARRNTESGPLESEFLNTAIAVLRRLDEN